MVVLSDYINILLYTNNIYTYIYIFNMLLLSTAYTTNTTTTYYY